MVFPQTINNTNNIFVTFDCSFTVNQCLNMSLIECCAAAKSPALYRNRQKIENMKSCILVFLLGIFFNVSFAQTLPDYSSIKLNAKEDFNSTANDAALQAANYILSSPIDNKNNDRLKSLSYIIRWMQGTPDYNFSLDDQATKFAKNSDELLGLYMAAMTKYVLENNADSKDQNKIKLNSVMLVVSYSRDPKNNVKLNKELKNLIKADDKGQLAEYLKL